MMILFSIIVIALGFAFGWTCLLTAIGISTVRAVRSQSLGDLPWLVKETGVMVYFTSIGAGSIFVLMRYGM